jgi:OmpA family/PEGA domain
MVATFFKELPSMTTKFFCSAVLFAAAGTFCAASVLAQSPSETGKLKIHVVPKQAYVFVDGKAIRDGSQTIKLTAGDHKIGVYNYGYQSNIQNVHIQEDKTTDVNVTLQAAGDKVSGPFADIEFKGDPRAAVLLNGDTPSYFVGHVDEFDWDWIWHQRLLVHPGTYQVNITREGNTIWSGSVTLKAGQKAIVHLNENGKLTVKDWKEGLNMPPQPRFHAGIASATVPVAPVSAELSAQSSNVSCGQSTTLDWKAANAVDTSISSLGEVPAAGDRSVSPTQNTTYVLTAKGPGGDSSQSVTIDVNVKPTASISLSQSEVRYHKIGDKVVEQGSATLNWSTSNANSAMVAPLDSEAASGNRTVIAVPKQTTVGPVNEEQTYTLTSTNPCGGTVTKTATLHVVGSIDPPPAITLASLFYPTAYPTRLHPKDGLLGSEKETLNEIAAHFKDYEQYDHAGTLLIVAHADIRGSRNYNQALSERRANLVKDYLVAQGVAADKIEIQAEGKDKQLEQQTVIALQSKDPEKPETWMTKQARTTWLAYNRRSDVILQPRDIQSTEDYPNAVADARLLWQRPEPSLRKVQQAEKSTSAASSLAVTASSSRN